MIVRSISKLPEVNHDFTTGKFEISLPVGVGSLCCVSKSVSYESLSKQIKGELSSSLVAQYCLDYSHDPLEQAEKVNVSAEAETIHKIVSGDMQFNGLKNFDKWPTVSADFPSVDQLSSYGGKDGEYILPNMKKVNELLQNNPIYISTTESQVAEGNPLPQHNDGSGSYVPGGMNYAMTIGQGKFYFWQIDNNQNDSSKSIRDINSGSTDGYELIRDTGNLVMWGWLADNGNVGAEYAWVGLFAKLKTEGNNDTQEDIPLQIQPWICGKYSNTLQYVGFNVPVRKGLRLKVKTGFPVNGVNSGLQAAGTMLFQDGFIPNAFFGYVIK